MYLIELLKDWPCTISGNWRDIEIGAVTEHPKRVTKGSLFVARKGARHDGLDSIEEGIHNGAAAIVVDRIVPEEQITYWVNRGVAVVTVSECKQFLSYSCAQLAGSPAEELTIISVTGTNGKTTVTHFVGQFLSNFGVKAAVIGTTGCYINGEKLDEETPSLTTLTAEYLHPLLKKCLERGVTHVALEASSLGLEMERLAHCRATVGVFLNIGVDHFEEHGGRDNYLNAKKKLCDLSDQILVNREDAACMKLVERANVPVHEFGRKVAGRFMPSEDLMAKLPPGEHNRLNAMAAAAVVCLLGFPERHVFSMFSELRLPEGRMQLAEQAGRQVFVDYAHTPDALEVVLQALTTIKKKQLICVFGCGGNRDKDKRPVMGGVAENYCDKIYVTSDNPRNENPEHIIQDILSGMKNTSTVIVEIDRKRAIQQAIELSEPQDIVLIAGKGHETSQLVSGKETELSDFKEVLAALNQLGTMK